MLYSAGSALRIDKGHNELAMDIFRAYDIRGVAGESLTPDTAFLVGKAFATTITRTLGKVSPTIALARDGRLSSPEMTDMVAQGMQSAGAHVLYTGIGPTPMLYFAVHHLKADAGLMVTGSHNPAKHNGFKMTIGTKPFYGDAIQELARIIQAGDFVEGRGGSMEEAGVFDAYVLRLMQGFEKKEVSVPS